MCNRRADARGGQWKGQRKSDLELEVDNLSRDCELCVTIFNVQQLQLRLQARNLHEILLTCLGSPRYLPR